mgnify:CR=1 FL=1
MEKNIPLLRGGFVILCLSGILFLISFVMSGLMAGRKDGDNEVHLTGFDRWKNRDRGSCRDRSMGSRNGSYRRHGNDRQR